MMHRPTNIKFISAKQAKDTYQYRNIKGKEHFTRTNNLRYHMHLVACTIGIYNSCVKAVY